MTDMKAFTNAGQYKKGHRQSAESRAKMSAAKIGYTPWNKGIPMSKETKEKISENRKGKGLGGGFPKGHASWNKGIGTKTSESKKLRMSKDFRDWRKAVFLRDDFTCQDCGLRGGKLHPDHIFPFAHFPEQRFLVENGQTLCEDCHRKTPTYGRKADDYSEFDFCPTYLIENTVTSKWRCVAAA